MGRDRVPAVLVTRPAGAAADRLSAALSRAGYGVHCQPMLQLEPVTALDARRRQFLRELDTYRHIIFVSANAVHFGLQHIERSWPQPPAAATWYAVGEATAQMLRTHGLPALAPGDDMTSEGLLALPGLRSVAGERVLIVKGEGGRDTLRGELSARGAQVDELACYRRRRPSLEAGQLAASLRDWRIDVVLFSSAEGMDNFAELLGPAETTTLESLCVVVPSQRVARAARDRGFRHVMTADNASDAAMLRALEACKLSPGGNK